MFKEPAGARGGVAGSGHDRQGPVWTPLIPATKSTKGHGADTFWGRPAQPAEIAPTHVFHASADGRCHSGGICSPTGTKDAARCGLKR